MGRNIALTVNGSRIERDVEPRTLLVYFLREELGLTGTHIGCDTSSCGACTVHLDGEAVKSCTVLAVQADGVDGHDDRGPRATTGCTPSSRPSTRRMRCSAATAPRG